MTGPHKQRPSEASGAEPPGVPLIRTKLYRPRLSSELVTRPRLLELLNRTLEVPLTLVSAPAGYGKTVLVGQWAERQEVPSAWLSLDTGDGDLRLFLTYLIAAIEGVSPEACPSTRELIVAPGLLPLKTIGGHLINELDAIETPFVVILDDYHRIAPSSAVHELLALVLENPPQPLHVVIATRHDPPLPASLMWGDRRAVSVRVPDLSFTRAEVHELLDKTTGLAVTEEALAHLDAELEGWAIGLRLLALRLPYVDDPSAFVKNLHGGVPHMQDYLFQEVLEEQTPEYRTCLLESSVLERFCPQLLEAVFGGTAGRAPHRLSGQEFVDRLQRGDLFTTSLDVRGHWFRYHHLVRWLLDRQLQREAPSSEIATLHARASTWFESQGLIDESIRHALKALDPDRAADIVARHRIATEEEGRWCDVERWLEMLPEDVKHQRLELLLAQMFLCIKRYRIDRLPPLIERAESLLAQEPAAAPLTAELDEFRGVVLVWLRCDGAEALKLLESARERGLPRSEIATGRLEFWLAIGRHLAGEGEWAIRSLEEQIRAAHDRPVLLFRLMWALGTVRMLSGDLSAAERQAEWMISTGPPRSSLEAWGYYYRANAMFQAYRREEALQSFLAAERCRDVFSRRFAIDTMAGLAWTHQALDRPDDAVRATEDLVELVRETGDPHHVVLVESLRARLALLRDDVDGAVDWANSLDEAPSLGGEFFFLEVPALTQARAWIASGTDEGLSRALERLAPLRDRFERLHFIAQSIEVHVLRAAAFEKKGDSDQARASLTEALARAAPPRGFVRPFVEAGPTMAALLDRLGGTGEMGEFARRLLAAFESGDALSPPALRPDRQPSSPPDLLAPLTNRQIDVLELLARRLRDKEIAGELSVSPATVNQHLKHLYRALDVRSRREAVARAVALGILHPTKPD
jgi:LuxR family maltose regulon positive regulatory protein